MNKEEFKEEYLKDKYTPDLAELEDTEEDLYPERRAEQSAIDNQSNK